MSVRLVYSQPDHAAPPRQKGSPDPRTKALAGGRLQVVAVGRAASPLPDPYRLRADMAERWSLWLRRNLASPEEAAVLFHVRGQTARNWWDGLHRPAGETVMMAQLIWGEAFLDFMRAAPGREAA
jgi:hypothetical protein